MTKPLIGLTFDIEPAGGYSNFPWYALRENYCGAITESGGIPLPLTHAMGHVDDYLNLLNGLIITGGNFDVDPALFGNDTVHSTVTTKATRTEFEIAITKKALERDMPILGICGGQQLLNVILGGTLIQHIPDEIPNALLHEQPNPRDEAGHTVAISQDTRLHRIVQCDSLSVNSAHHQAVKTVGKDVKINALASDGVIEGIESTAHRFCLGLQWHPEFFISQGDKHIYTSFMEACRG